LAQDFLSSTSSPDAPDLVHVAERMNISSSRRATSSTRSLDRDDGALTLSTAARIGLSERALRTVRSLQDQLRRTRDHIKKAEEDAKVAMATRDHKIALWNAARERRCQSAELVQQMKVQKAQDLDLQAALAKELEAILEELAREKEFRRTAAPRPEFERLQQDLQAKLTQLEEARSTGCALKAELEVTSAECAAMRERKVSSPPVATAEETQLLQPAWQSFSICSSRGTTGVESAQEKSRQSEAKTIANKLAAVAMKVQRAKDLRRQAHKISDFQRRNELLQAQYQQCCEETATLEMQLEAARAQNHQLEAQEAQLTQTSEARVCEMQAELRRQAQQIRVLRSLCEASFEEADLVVNSTSASVSGDGSSFPATAGLYEVVQPIRSSGSSSAGRAEAWWGEPSRHMQERPSFESPCNVSAEVCLSSRASPAAEVSFGDPPQAPQLPYTWPGAGCRGSMSQIEADEVASGVAAVSGDFAPQLVPLNLGELFSATMSPNIVVAQDASCLGTPSPGSMTFSLGAASLVLPEVEEAVQTESRSPSRISLGSDASHSAPDASTQTHMEQPPVDRLIDNDDVRARHSFPAVAAHGDEGGGPCLSELSSRGSADAAGGGEAIAGAASLAATVVVTTVDEVDDESNLSGGQPLLRALDLQVITRNQRLIDEMAERHTM